MRDLITWYLVDLKLRLKDHISDSQIEIIITETENHLMEAVAELRMSQGISEYDAATVAIKKFGPPHAIAISHIREANHTIRGFNAKSLVIAASLVAILCLTQIFLPYKLAPHVYRDPTYLITGPLAFLATGVLGVVIIRSHSAHLRSISFSGLLALSISIPICAFCMIGSNGSRLFSRFEVDKQMENANLNLNRLKKIDAYYREAIVAFHSARTLEEIPLKFRGGDWLEKSGTTIPNRIVPASLTVKSLESDQIGLMVTPETVFTMQSNEVFWGPYAVPASFKTTKAQWQASDPTYFPTVAASMLSYQKLLTHAKELKSGRIFFLDPTITMEVISLIAVFSGLLGLVALIANWLNHLQWTTTRRMA